MDDQRLQATDAQTVQPAGDGWTYPHIWREPRRWRRYQYGKHRSMDQNFRAWFFADRYGRAVIRELRQIKRHIRRERKR